MIFIAFAADFHLDLHTGTIPVESKVSLLALQVPASQQANLPQLGPNGDEQVAVPTGPQRARAHMAGRIQGKDSALRELFWPYAYA